MKFISSLIIVCVVALGLSGCASFELGSFVYCKKDANCKFEQVEKLEPAPSIKPPVLLHSMPSRP